MEKHFGITSLQTGSDIVRFLLFLRYNWVSAEFGPSGALIYAECKSLVLNARIGEVASIES